MGQHSIPGRMPGMSFLVQWESVPGGKRRTLAISGEIRNVKVDRKPLPKVEDKACFDDAGHLIAHRFGGPDLIENLAPMHNRINVRGTPWGAFEEHVAKKMRLEGPATMSVSVKYEQAGLRPHLFFAQVVFRSGERVVCRMYNYAPYLIPRTASEYERAREGDNVSPVHGAFTYLSKSGKTTYASSVLPR